MKIHRLDNTRYNWVDISTIDTINDGKDIANHQISTEAIRNVLDDCTPIEYETMDDFRKIMVERIMIQFNIFKDDIKVENPSKFQYWIRDMDYENMAFKFNIINPGETIKLTHDTMPSLRMFTIQILFSKEDERAEEDWEYIEYINKMDELF